MRANVVFNKGQWNTDQAIPWDFFHGERFFFFSLKFLFETFEEIPPRVRGIPHFHTDLTQSCYCRIKEATSILSA